MHLQTAGAGPAILLLHAFPLDARMWQRALGDLAADHRVLAPDMPGFGKSEQPQGNPSLDDWARAVLALCKANDVPTALIAGCSMGGYLAFAMNRIEPGFAAGFALVNTRAAADTQDARRTRYEMVERARHEGTAFLQATEPPLSPQTLVRHPEITAFAREMMADATPVGVMAAQRAMASRKDSRAQLPELRVPTSVIYGVDDFIISRDEVESMAAAIPNARFVPIADAGHLSPMDKPAEISAAIRSVAQAAFR
jgi:pimeloyl-ACP methyl ester carboxylesterase